MLKFTTSLLLFVLGSNSFAQNTEIDRNNAEIRSILTGWDPVRGEWLSSSLVSFSNNIPVPVRTFPERLTASQLFAFVPIEKRDSVEQLLVDNDSIRRSNGIDMSKVYVDLTRIAMAANRRGRNLSSFTYGDPHIVDFNNEYKFLTSTGEFVLAKSKSSSFEVQARFEKINEMASFTTAVSINADGDIVSFYANEKPDGRDFTVMRVNGEAKTTTGGTYYLPMGGFISYDGNQYQISTSNGESVIIIFKPYQDKKYLNIAIEIPEEQDSNYEGLSVDNSTSDFRVEKGSTLFKYADGKDFEHYNRLLKGSSSKVNISHEQKKIATEKCQNAGVRDAEMNGCIYDYAVLGIAPNLRPEFFDPTNEVILSDLDMPSQRTDQIPLIPEITTEQANEKREVFIFRDPTVRREVTNAVLRFIVEAAVQMGSSGPSMMR